MDIGTSKAIVEAISVPAILLDPAGRITASNPGARSLLADGLDGRHHTSVLRHPGMLEAIAAAIATATPQVAQYLATDVRGDVGFTAYCQPVKGAGLLVCFEDRTEAETAGRMRRDFVANVSHELRTPLTALSGFIETLKGAARDDAEARARFLQIMEGEASRMNRLVDDLLSLSQVETDERKVPTSRVDLAAVVRAVIGTLTPLATAHDVALNADLDHAVHVIADADQLAQVATNLIENAIKYGGPDVQVTLTRVARDPILRRPCVELSVADTGDGFDPVHIPRLTERFYRIDDHRSRQMGGTGLGLAIVKHIVSRHRGRLRIKSTPGQGSRFTVSLPEAAHLS